jgi:hypothetical protein
MFVEIVRREFWDVIWYKLYGTLTYPRVWTFGRRKVLLQSKMQYSNTGKSFQIFGATIMIKVYSERVNNACSAFEIVALIVLLHFPIFHPSILFINDQ